MEIQNLHIVPEVKVFLIVEEEKVVEEVEAVAEAEAEAEEVVKKLNENLQVKNITKI